MPTLDPQSLLARLLQESGECPWLEFKRNNWNPEMVGKYVSACANASILAGRDRAFLIWGIEDGTRKRVGTDIRLMDQKKGNANFPNWISQIIEPHLIMEFLDFEDDGLKFSILTIEPTYDRPVRYAGAAYIRIGENVKSLRDFPEHERALWLATARHKFENAVALSHQSSDEVINKLDIKALFVLEKIAYPNTKAEIMRHLCSVGLIKDDLEGGYDITNLGALLFAQNIRIFPSIATKSVRVIKYSGIDKSRSEGEIEGQRGYAIGFQGLVKYIMDALPKHETYENGVRDISSTYSDVAIREIVANALIHQDLTITGSGPMIEIYKDRVEVISPGNSLISRDRLIDERKSRNERLARAMRELGFCEERGGGIDKAIIHIEDMSLPAPLFLVSENSMRVILFGPKKFSDLTRTEKIWSCFCHCVVRWIRHEYMNNSTLRERFSLPTEEYQAVSTVISDARKDGKIIFADPTQTNRYARYVPYWARELSDG